MVLIDTHCHLYSEEFAEDSQAMFERAKASGVNYFCLPAIDSSHTENMYLLKEKYPDEVFLMMGLHPCYVKENYLEELTFVKTELEKNTFVAIGEIGIDLYWDKATLAIQQEAFKQQIHWAIDYNLPIVIHARESLPEIFEVMDSLDLKNLTGVFHCFSGNYEQALKVLSYGFYLGIGGVVTFKNGKIDQFIHQIPLDKIVLETDAPYLAPVPNRGKRNEPAYLINVLNKLSELYALSGEEIATQTTINAKKLFQL